MLQMTELQAWALIGLFAAEIFGVIAIMPTLFVRAVRSEIGGLRGELGGLGGAQPRSARSDQARVRRAVVTE